MPSLPAGARLGPYQVVSLLGAGGMGEVYRARDERLRRDVAIKVLPEAFAADPDRIARFHREAQAVAALNHPHISAIYGFEEQDATRFLVLELIEGESLSDRIARGPLPGDEALRIASQICEALEAAHEKAIVHRDLKPANIKLTPDGKVKVLDFGLAKALDTARGPAELSQSPTLSLAATQAGVILGTAAYMAPEQAKGLPADHRADIFAFGCVLFEMLTGRQAFDGDSVSEVLASVLKSEPDFALLPPRLHPRLTVLLRRCLAKSPRDRWHSAADVRIELDAIARDPRGLVIDVAAGAPARPVWARALGSAGLVVLGALIAAAIASQLWPAATRTPVARFTITLPTEQRFTTIGRQSLAISPDGSQMVYVANRQLHLRVLADSEPRPIRGAQSASAVLGPAFMPDGDAIVYYDVADLSFKRVPVTGGPPATLARMASTPYGVSTARGVLLVGSDRGVLRIPADGGEPETLIPFDTGEIAGNPQLLPDGDTVLLTLATGTAPDRWEQAQIVTQSIATKQRKLLGIRGGDARYLPTGHIVYASGGTLFAVPFDADRLEVLGSRAPVLEGVRRAVGVVSTAADSHFAFSDTGTLIYISGPLSPGTDSVVSVIAFDRTGAASPLRVRPGAFAAPRVSPDDTRLLFSRSDATGTQVWLFELSGESAMRPVTSGGNNRFPVWLDNERIAFQSDREGGRAIWAQRADGSGVAERLTNPAADVDHTPESAHPDGDTLAYTETGRDRGLVRVLSRRAKTDIVITQGGAATGRAAFAPDGRWLAYQFSKSADEPDIYVEPFPPDGSTRHRVSLETAIHPFWARKGLELLYVPRQSLVSTRITTTPSFRMTEPEVWRRPATLQIGGPLGRRNLDVMGDGRLVGASFIDTLGGTAPERIEVVINWFEEVKRRVN